MLLRRYGVRYCDIVACRDFPSEIFYLLISLVRFGGAMDFAKGVPVLLLSKKMEAVLFRSEKIPIRVAIAKRFL